eukprot:gene19364-16845_t
MWVERQQLVKEMQQGITSSRDYGGILAEDDIRYIGEVVDVWWPPEGKYYRATITKRKERRSSHNIYYHATFANDGSIGYDLQVKTHHLIPHGSGDERERASKLKRRRNTADNDVDDREDQGSASTSAHAASSLSASAESVLESAFFHLARSSISALLKAAWLPWHAEASVGGTVRLAGVTMCKKQTCKNRPRGKGLCKLHGSVW